MKNLYLTRTGLMLSTLSGKYFFSNDGTFRRKAGKKEAEYITKEAVELEENWGVERLIEKMRETISNIGDWKFLISTTIEENDFSYDPRFCNNGGCYSFYTKRTFLYRRIGNNIQIAYLDTFRTSAELPYCEMTGTFYPVDLWDFEDMEANIYSSHPLGVVEEYATTVEVEEIFKMEKIYIFPKDEEREDKSSPLFSLTEKKGILATLKEAGWKKSAKIKICFNKPIYICSVERN